MSRALRVALVALAAAAPAARAADHADTRRFVPAPVPSPYLALAGTRPLAEGGVALGLRAAYESRPLIFYKDGERTTDIIAHRWQLDVAAGYGLLPGFDLGLSCPLVVDQAGQQPDGQAALESFAAGDPAVSASYTLLDPDADGFGLAVVGSLSLPFGDDSALAGERNVAGTGALAAELPLGSRFDVGVNVGWRARPETHLEEIPLDDELLLGLGTSWRASPDLSFVLEGRLATPGTDPFASTERSPADIDLGVRQQLAPGVHVLAGAGAGVFPGYGAPAWRAFAGFEIAPRRHDWDGDGVADGRDRCLSRPGLVEHDGCPPPVMLAGPQMPPADADADADGLMPGVDRCPYVAEDRDGFRDADGCPDDDDDLDLVPDTEDHALLDPEDWDGFADADGVPDTDDDADGVADLDDACPQLAGAFGGCPEPPAPSTDGPVLLGDTIHPRPPLEFESGVTLAGGEAALAGLAAFLRAHPELGRVEVGVHLGAAADRDRARARRLSQARAEALRAALVSRGVDAARLEARGYGRSTAARVELRVIAPPRSGAAEAPATTARGDRPRSEVHP